jgi:hypothetical protein
MIKVGKSQREYHYCNSCCSRETKNAYEIRFGDPSVANVSVMTICGACLLMIKKQIGEVNFSD